MWHLRLREIATAKGYSIARLEREAVMDIKTVRRLWHNPQTDTSLSTLARLAKVLNVAVIDLLIEKEEY
jgi:transcriptional regulator with XRE-family HTH domain